MIVTVTPNPALDLTWQAPGLIPGQSHRVDSGTARAGGKGLNVARVLHSQGIDVLALTTAGGDSGREFLVELAASGIAHTIIPVQGATRKSITIVNTDVNETTVLNEYGARVTEGEVTSLIAQTRSHAETAQAIAISGSMPVGFSSDDLVALIGAARSHGAAVLVDTSGPALLAAARAGATVLKPNDEELRAATGIADPVLGAQALIEAGAHAVLVSLGSRGLLIAHSDGRAVTAKLDRVVVGNATGAGDAVSAAIVAALEMDPKLQDIVNLARTAAAWGAAAVAMPLAGEISHDALAWMADVTVTELP